MQDYEIKDNRTVRAVNDKGGCAVAQWESRKKKEREELSLEDLSHKPLLTLEEANRYTGLGLQKLRDLTNGKDCRMVLWNGSKRMIKRGKLEEYLNAQYSI